MSDEVHYVRYAAAGEDWGSCAHSEFASDQDPRWPEIEGYWVAICHGCGGPVLEREE